jgi:hypothetical protein
MFSSQCSFHINICKFMRWQRCICVLLWMCDLPVALLWHQQDFMKRGIKICPRKITSCCSCYFSKVIKKTKMKHLRLQRHNTANWIFWSFHRFVFETYILPGYECNLQTTILPISLGSGGMKIKNVRKTCKNDSCYTFLETLRANFSFFRTLLKS